MTTLCFYCLLIVPLFHVCSFLFPYLGLSPWIAANEQSFWGFCLYLLPAILFCVIFVLTVHPDRSAAECKRVSKRLTLLKIIYAAYFVSLVVFSIFFIRTGRHQVGGFVTILFALYVLITYLPAYLAFNIATTFVCAKLLRCSYLSYYLPRQYPLLHLIPIADAISAIHVNKIVKNMVVTDPKA